MLTKRLKKELTCERRRRWSREAIRVKFDRTVDNKYIEEGTKLEGEMLDIRYLRDSRGMWDAILFFFGLVRLCQQ